MKYPDQSDLNIATKIARDYFYNCMYQQCPELH